MMTMFFRIAAAVFLIGLSVSDLKSRTIPVWPVLVFAAATAILHLILQDMRIPELLTGVLPGLAFFLIGTLYPSAIGSGDGLAIASCGAALGPAEEFSSLITAFLLSFLYSVFLLIRKKAARKDSFPFLPFLTAGHILVFLAEVRL